MLGLLTRLRHVSLSMHQAAEEGQSLNKWVGDPSRVHVGQLFDDGECERAEGWRYNAFVGLHPLLLGLECAARMMDLPRDAVGGGRRVA